jgi:hypothetical protein
VPIRPATAIVLRSRKPLVVLRRVSRVSQARVSEISLTTDVPALSCTMVEAQGCTL